LSLASRRVRALHGAGSSLFFNFFLLLVSANLAAAGLMLVADQLLDRPSIDSRVVKYRRRFADLDAYKRVPPAEALQYLNEQDRMASLGFRYAPWMEFANVPYQGRLLSTDERGFRRGRAPRPHEGPSLEVFVFGGSTTFGYGIPDGFTIPSFLQQQLEEQAPNQSIRVSNFGQGYYYSSQELALFVSLLKEQRIPAVAVFVDGANDTALLALGRDEPWFSQALTNLWEIGQGKGSFPWDPTLSRFALYGVIHRSRVLLRRFTGTRGGENEAPPALPLTDQQRVEYVVSRYRASKRMIAALCAEYGVRCLFVWQPVPFYKYDRRLHRTFPFDGPIPGHWAGVYERMSTLKDADFLYLGDMLESVTEKVFVDDVHYNEVLSERIAASISRELVGRGLALPSAP
jgi:hypothetical protein